MRHSAYIQNTWLLYKVHKILLNAVYEALELENISRVKEHKKVKLTIQTSYNNYIPVLMASKITASKYNTISQNLKY